MIPKRLLLREIPRLLVAVCFPRNVHRDRYDPFRPDQITLFDAGIPPTHRHKYPTFPITAVEFGASRRFILDKLAPSTL